ncbi:MAG: hypothetical protein H6765_10535 [Candidatus Peribacteria bacterium]|nr:MAG: hypothetical protein H6765_10535 [Candidatus Peribacteria bacterium]
MATGANYDLGDQVCNTAQATSSGNREDPVEDTVCLTLTGSCIKNCAATVSATGFAWNQTAPNTIQVTATCMSEATCGDSNEWDAVPAELVYRELTHRVDIVENATLQIPSWSGAGFITVSVAGLTACGSDTGCAYTLISNAINAVDVVNGFDNYSISPQVEWYGTHFNVISYSRTWRHWVTC